MPGLQSIVSAWTKINNDHVQYFENGPGGRPQQLLRPGQHPGQPPQLVGPNGLPLVNGPGGAPMEQQGGGGGAVVAGAVDPRTTTYAPSPAGLSHHSGSSLSSVSFSKNGIIQGQGSATTVGTTTTPMSSTQSLLGNAPPSQRYPLHHPGQSMASSQQRALPPHAQQTQQLLGMLTSGGDGAAMAPGQRSPLHRPSRRANHHSHHGHLNHYNGGLQRQLESYGGNPNAAMPPPPPQAGADAILGRRKNNAGIDRSDSPGNLGEPPASLSTNAAIPPGATNPMARGASALSRSPSSSLWHSQRKSSNLSVGSSDTSAGGAASVTASLEKMNISSLRNGHGPGMQHLSRQQNEAAIAELNKTAETALQNMQNLGGNGSTPPQSNVASHQGNTLGGGNSSSSQTSSVVVPLPQQQQTSTIPIPPQARPGASRRRIRKSHSRTDLVREMALDKPRGSHGARKRSSTVTSASSQATPKIHNRADSELDLSSSMGSQVARQMLGVGGVGAGAGQPKQGQRRSQDFLSRTATIDESEPSHMSSSADSSSHGGKQPQQQQQGGIGEAIRMTVPTALNDGRHRPYSQLADRQHPYDRIGELADPLDRHAAAAPGGQWMQGMFPNNQQMPARRDSRVSSSGSSGTAITGNRSMALSSALSKVSGEGMGNIEEQSAYEQQMQQPAPSTAAAAVVAGAAAAAGATNDGTLPSKQQMGMDPPLQGDPNCERCARMEATLLSLQADLEYMRTLELQREFHCKQCETGNVLPGNARLDRLDSNLPSIDQKVRYRHQSSDRSVSSAVSIGSRGSRTSSRMHRRASVKSAITSARTVQTAGRSMGSRTTMFLRDASRRLADLSTRHKRQVKQTTHERAYWQNDMHLKLEKFAMMCKNLNEEAAHRSNEVKETKALLDKMTAERNALVSHVDTLKARVELYESEGVEQSKRRGDWEAEKALLMERIDAAGKDQEAAIADLSNRLELAVETIDSERKQQRMRRQIIFPQSGDGTAPSSPHINPHEPSKGDDMERIQKTKEVARKAQQSLEAVMVQSAEREKAMQARLDVMERELAEAKATALGFESTVHVPLAMEGRASIRRSSSSTSLASVGGL